MSAVSSHWLLSSEPVSLAFALYTTGDRTSVTATIDPDEAQIICVVWHRCNYFIAEQIPRRFMEYLSFLPE